VDAGVLALTLDRPDKRNAMDRDMVAELRAAVDDADVRSDVSVVVLRGAGKDFCAGADLQELLDSVDAAPETLERHAMELGELFIALRRLPKPVVAVVHGRALAGGCGLATACDLIVAHEQAQFGYPEIRRGFVPAMAMAMLVRAVGEKTAFDLVATGRLLSADDARAVGLVSRVCESDSFEEAVRALVSELAGASGSALAMIKQQLYALEGRAFEDAVAFGAKVNATARMTPDFRQAVSAFLDKRN
jgi:methylglutaconyl-CoA hydratase